MNRPCARLWLYDTAAAWRLSFSSQLEQLATTKENMSCNYWVNKTIKTSLMDLHTTSLGYKELRTAPPLTKMGVSPFSLPADEWWSRRSSTHSLGETSFYSPWYWSSSSSSSYSTSSFSSPSTGSWVKRSLLLLIDTSLWRRRPLGGTAATYRRGLGEEGGGGRRRRKGGWGCANYPFY